jgi:superoxide dismutase, Cu-Zn family
MRTLRVCLVAAAAYAAVAATSAPAAETTTVPMTLVDARGQGAAVGEIVLSESHDGLVLTPRLRGLPPGLHGFHVHEHPSCAPAEKDGTKVPAQAAGAHYDPQGSGKHGLPWGDGHLGDLPALYVAADGTATYPVFAPRLKLKDVSGRSLMVHAGGDNHSDHPQPLGGGGGRIACGVIP